MTPSEAEKIMLDEIADIINRHGQKKMSNYHAASMIRYHIEKCDAAINEHFGIKND